MACPHEGGKTHGEMPNVPEILICTLAGQHHFHARLVNGSKNAVLGVDGWRSKWLFLHAH